MRGGLAYRKRRWGQSTVSISEIQSSLYLFYSSQSKMETLPLEHRAITPKILHLIFAKVIVHVSVFLSLCLFLCLSSLFVYHLRCFQTTKISAIRLAQTGRLGRDIFRRARSKLVRCFWQLEITRRVSLYQEQQKKLFSMTDGFPVL